MSYQKLQANRAVAVTPSNTANISDSTEAAKSGVVLYIGTGGDLKVLTSGGDEVTFTNIQDGSFLPVQVLRVFATGTTATNIVALW
jgi:hypothetical protein